ncbi:MAG: tRNA(Ile)(2)-agmatinylcytidine synthase [Asgard group archaeon]|nr:tRNA(Ile)(2)-agmatinylcytidine synthase [Asgard group archaeon]
MTKVLSIGFDDTDSLRGSCTTYLATLIIHRIGDYVEFLDLPHLIRLNPNIPYKTRGNGAVALRIRGEKADLLYCKEVVLKQIEKSAEMDMKNTNPGVVFIEGKIPSSVKKHTQKALWQVLTIKETEQLAQNPQIEIHKFKTGRGIIGAFGALGHSLQSDHTYEHLSYRKRENFGTDRRIDEKSVYKADKATPLTFSNIDYEYDSIMITPRGADPVFAGIRGETITTVREAWSYIKPLEPIPMQMVFKTNQHTNQHFQHQLLIKNLQPHLSAIIEGVVTKTPRYITGGHLIFSIKDASGEIDCAAYEPTKRFRGQINGLLKGDRVKIFGGIRSPGKNHPMTINIERLQVLTLRPKMKKENPFCDECGTRLKSAGKNKGYKCPNCSKVFRNAQPIYRKVPRSLKIKEYLPPVVAHRHLTKPVAREKSENYGKKLSKKVIQKTLQDLIAYGKAHKDFNEL